jgi:hypothetical protein
MMVVILNIILLTSMSALYASGVKELIVVPESRISPPLPELLLIAKSSRWVVLRYACNTHTFQVQVVKAWVDWIGLDWGIFNKWWGREDCGISQKQRTCVFALVPRFIIGGYGRVELRSYL